jgi:peptide/nickel transport system permease protein
MMRDLRALFGRFCGKRSALVGLALLLIVAGIAAAAPVLYPGDPAEMVASPLLHPGQDWVFPLGSDQLGRDLAAGLAHGARTALLIGFVSTSAALLVGVAAGAVAGYYGGWIESAVMRVTELFQTMPQFILVLVLVVLFTPSITTTIIAVALVSWPPVARLVRAEVLSLREREFVESCFTIGMSRPAIIFSQILPNCLAPIIAFSSIMVASAILIEASLSFLGLGDPNLVTWGSMIGQGRNHLRTAWFLVTEPGVALLVTVLSLNLISEGLNDALNPRLREPWHE